MDYHSSIEILICPAYKKHAAPIQLLDFRPNLVVSNPKFLTSQQKNAYIVHNLSIFFHFIFVAYL